jgi:ABC-type lipoprotein release transport system permease subunit
MRYEFELACSFMKSTGNKKFFHPHIILSILGIAVGVSFFVFALSMYDGYVKKMENIVFSFFPQITLQSDSSNSEDDVEINNDLITLEEKKDDRCEKVCSGEIILEDRTLAKEDDSSGITFALDNYNDMKGQWQTIEGIRRVSPIIFEEANFIYSYIVGGQKISAEGPLRVLGVQSRDGSFVPEIERTITDKSLLTALEDPDSQYVILSAELYQTLFRDSPHNKAKDKKKIVVYIKSKTSDETQETPVELTTAGVFKLGMHKISENMIITSLKTAQKIFSMENQASFVGISLIDPYQAERIADEIKQLNVKNEWDIHTYHWMAVAADMFNSLSFYRNIVIIVLLMSILITSFNIYTTLNIMILERKKQIGILRSMGIKKFSLYRTFFIISQIEAVIGIAAGLAAGVLLGYYFSGYFQRSLEAFLHIQDPGTVIHGGTVLFIVCSVCLLCGLTAFAATRKGANLDPVDALRSE